MDLPYPAGTPHRRSPGGKAPKRRWSPSSSSCACAWPDAAHLAEDGTLPLSWLIAEWPDQAAEPVKYWISNLPEHTEPAELVRLAKIRWRIEHDYRELKTALGLDHFEGRSWTGWHRHVTLVTAAHLFCTILRTDPKAAAPA